MHVTLPFRCYLEPIDGSTPVFFIGGPHNNKLLHCTCEMSIDCSLVIRLPDAKGNITAYYLDGRLATGVKVMSCLWGRPRSMKEIKRKSIWIH